METKYLRLFVKFGDHGRPRVGIAPSGSIFKKATDRNRARRLISAAIEAIYPRLPGNINILALPKARVIAVKSSEVLSDMEAGLKKMEII